METDFTPAERIIMLEKHIKKLEYEQRSYRDKFKQINYDYNSEIAKHKRLIKKLEKHGKGTL